ncbi:hypothetical protein LguiA_009872 [Lonicera macranthoides]
MSPQHKKKLDKIKQDKQLTSKRHSISGDGIFSYDFGTGYGGSAQDYASSGGSNNTIASRGGYYGSGRGTYHDGSSSSNDYRGFGYYHHDGQPNFLDYESSSHSSHPYPTSANSQSPLYPHSSSLEFLSGKRRKKKRVRFAESVKEDSSGNLSKQIINEGGGEGGSSKYRGLMMMMPANRVALYSGILKSTSLSCSYDMME